ncbi:MAG: ABC transporter ATP-binding protein, partial [Croceitalea sp.]|nr:ABC transporter ATP-binding protein [Croceitalea sp.]
QIPFTIAKKIVLARSIVRKPKLLILKDPLDQFFEKEATEIMDFLTDKANGWAIVVVSENAKWSKRCGRIITMVNGKITEEKSNSNA